jgi:hypothetical protein
LTPARGRFPALLGPLIAERWVGLALAAIGALQVALVSLRLPGWPCAFRKATGIPCPGCGLTRALSALARGDWQTALTFHAFAPVFAGAGLLLVASLLLRAEPRARLAAWIGRLESRTGLAVWGAAALLVYWVVRLLYYPLTFTPPG